MHTQAYSHRRRITLNVYGYRSSYTFCVLVLPKEQSRERTDLSHFAYLYKAPTVLAVVVADKIEILTVFHEVMSRPISLSHFSHSFPPPLGLAMSHHPASCHPSFTSQSGIPALFIPTTLTFFQSSTHCSAARLSSEPACSMLPMSGVSVTLGTNTPQTPLTKPASRSGTVVEGSMLLGSTTSTPHHATCTCNCPSGVRPPIPLFDGVPV